MKFNFSTEGLVFLDRKIRNQFRLEEDTPMKKSINLVIMTALAALFLTAMAFAQMGMGMSGGKNQMMGTMSPDSTNAMMMQMSKNHTMMNRDLMRMQEHLQAMMKMDDVSALRTEMKKQMEMVQALQKSIGEQDRMYRTMMDSQGVGHMQGTEGTGNMQSMEGMPRKAMEESSKESMKKEKKY